MRPPRIVWATALVLVGSSANAFTQNPVRLSPSATAKSALEIDDSSLQAMTSGTGTIAGRAIDAGTHLPIAGATVTIGVSGRRPVRATTDAQGAFLVAGLGGGIYSVSVTRDGYLPGAFGRMRPNGTSQALTLNNGERRDSVEVELWQFGRIEGEVADDARAPLAAVSLQAISRAVVAGTPQWVPGRRAESAGDGTYHLDSLAPGSWIIAATSPQRGTTFYPSSPTTSGAVPVDLPSGATRSGIDFLLTPAVAFAVSGVVSRVDGPAAGVRLILESLDPMAAALAPRTVRSAADGRYLFTDVAPGDYRVRAFDPVVVTGRATSLMPASDDQFRWADANVSVNDRAVTNADLLVLAAPRVSGVLRFVGAADKPVTELLTTAQIFLDPADGRPSAVSNIGAIGADGVFTTSAIVPGRYLLRMAGTQSWRGWSMASARVDGNDISDVPVEITRDLSEVVVTFTDQPSQLSGNVTSASGAADTHAIVIVFPQDRDRWIGNGQNPRRMRRLATDASGHYSAINLPAGLYCVAAVDEAAGAAWNDPALLEALMRTAALVTIRDGGAVTQSLRTVVVKR